MNKLHDHKFVDGEEVVNNNEVVDACNNVNKNALASPLPIRTSTRDEWTGNFYCVDIREEHLGEQYHMLALQQQFR